MSKKNFVFVALFLFMSVGLYMLRNGSTLLMPHRWDGVHGTSFRAISMKIIVGIADAMVTSGLRDAGYVYINIDDCWYGNRDATDLYRLMPKFPHGMKWLSDYVHSKGLKLGIYSDCGTQTCAEYAWQSWT